MGIRVALIATAFAMTLPPALVTADETCNSPYLTKLIKGQEDYVHVWTLGVEGSATVGQARHDRCRTRSRSSTAR